MCKKRGTKLLVVLLVLLAAGFSLRWFLSKDRRRGDWTRQAVSEITALTSNQGSIAGEIAAIEQHTSAAPAPQGAWVGDHAALMRNGQWIAFKNECVHRHQLLGDIFIAKASDGRWYYSSFHFCCEMLVPKMDTQPPDLQTFIAKYFLKPFDGNPDSPQPAQQTWTPGSTSIHG